ncbi:hypothetical protein HanXRQr2_Chr16g0750511 [Helianthus annuus]|uniref:Secreted protein n=1 Tax=Helianthus annuus TaxID=4232 RepID=A0A251S3A0_HELAN|nr:hypothetical protein HanXRQr2_Chr16g0750511 [Helianthus annuus]
MLWCFFFFFFWECAHVYTLPCVNLGGGGVPSFLLYSTSPFFSLNRTYGLLSLSGILLVTFYRMSDVVCLRS